MDSFARSPVPGKKNRIEEAYQQARQDSEILILLEDEAGFHRQPTIAPLWAPSGSKQPRAAFAHRANSAVRAAIGFDPVAGRLIHRLRSSFTAVEMGRFYQHLAQGFAQAKQIFLVMDNWPIHQHPRAWAYLQAAQRIEVLWLPTYAPWLNPAEKVWKWLRQKLTHMHSFATDLKELRERLDQTLTAAKQNPAALLQYTGTGNYKLYRS